MNWELEKYYRVRDVNIFSVAISYCQYHNFSIPTQLVINEPRIVVPDQGRVYSTYLMTLEGVLYTDHTRWNKAFREGKNPKEVHVIEIFSDSGEDGHKAYDLVGFFLTDRFHDKDFDAFTEGLKILMNY